MSLRVVFAGTPAFSLPCLRALLAADGAEVVGIITAPDRPAGRGRRLQIGAVRAFAQSDSTAQNIALLQPESPPDAGALEWLKRLRADLMVVVAFGLLLPPAVLAMPRLGCVNLHASLLPRWRGAAPIARAIAAGDAVTGVSLMQMDAGLDTGPVLARATVSIGAQTAGELHDELAAVGARLLADNLPALAAGALSATPQDEARATYAAKLTKAEARLDWRRSASALARQVRAFYPWPVAFTDIGGANLRVLQAAVAEAPVGATPGEVISADSAGIVVASGRGGLALTVVQRPGGRPMAAAEFVNGAKIVPGMRCAGVGDDGDDGDARARTATATATVADSAAAP